MESFDILCKDYVRNAPYGQELTYKEFLCAVKWDDGAKSCNQLLVDIIKKLGWPYLNDAGVIWFKKDGEWCKTGHIVFDDWTVVFYILRKEPKGVV